MAVAYYTNYAAGDLAGGETPESIAARVAEGVNRRMGDKPPAGGVYHAEGPTEDGGWWVFDVWASDEEYEAFRQDVVQPALDEAGVAVSPPEVRRLRVWWDSSQVGGGS